MPGVTLNFIHSGPLGAGGTGTVLGDGGVATTLASLSPNLDIIVMDQTALLASNPTPWIG